MIDLWLKKFRIRVGNIELVINTKKSIKTKEDKLSSSQIREAIDKISKKNNG